MRLALLILAWFFVVAAATGVLRAVSGGSPAYLLTPILAALIAWALFARARRLRPSRRIDSDWYES